MIDRETIKRIALESGFTLRDQPDGTKDLNPYVYGFAKRLFACFAVRTYADSAQGAEPVAWMWLTPNADGTWRQHFGESRPPITGVKNVTKLFARPQPAIPPGWRPIATAPKGGTHVLIKHGEGLPATCHWFDGGWHLSVNQRGEYSAWIWAEPTHWMPIPDAPK